jgi:hypothetical protein
MAFEVAKPEAKRFKLFIWGPPGSFKTRVSLGLACSTSETTSMVIDTERGTDHYAGEFKFFRIRAVDRSEIEEAVEKVIAAPNGIKTIIVDSFSIYYEALVTAMADIFLIREQSGKGNKRDYYRLQPGDYPIINREAARFVRKLIDCDLNVIVTCQSKNEWTDMQVTGETFDAWRRLPYYFDTVIKIKQGKNGWEAESISKDRSGFLKSGAIPWGNSNAATVFLKKAGFDLTGEPVTVSESTPLKSESQPSAPATATPAPEQPPLTNEKKAWPEMASEASLKTIVELYNRLEMSKQEWLAKLAKYNATSAKTLTEGQAAELIESLKNSLMVKEQNDEIPFETTASPT